VPKLSLHKEDVAAPPQIRCGERMPEGVKRSGGRVEPEGAAQILDIPLRRPCFVPPRVPKTSPFAICELRMPCVRCHK
jgi:hypothetical protein